MKRKVEFAGLESSDLVLVLISSDLRETNVSAHQFGKGHKAFYIILH